MAGEVQAPYGNTGRTCYFNVRTPVGTIWNGSAFEAYATANYANYDVALVEQGTAGRYYVGTFPPTISAGVYSIVAKEQAGGTPAETDQIIAMGDFQWDGSAALPLSNLATSGQIGNIGPVKMARGVMVTNFGFWMVGSTDHISPFVSGVVSGQILRDNGAFGALQSGAFTEKGQGYYTLQALTSGDLACNTAGLLFTAVGVSGGSADPVKISLVMQRTSGSP